MSIKPAPSASPPQRAGVTGISWIAVVERSPLRQDPDQAGVDALELLVSILRTRRAGAGIDRIPLSTQHRQYVGAALNR